MASPASGAHVFAVVFTGESEVVVPLEGSEGTLSAKFSVGLAPLANTGVSHEVNAVGLAHHAARSVETRHLLLDNLLDFAGARANAVLLIEGSQFIGARHAHRRVRGGGGGRGHGGGRSGGGGASRASVVAASVGGPGSPAPALVTVVGPAPVGGGRVGAPGASIVVAPVASTAGPGGSSGGPGGSGGLGSGGPSGCSRRCRSRSAFRFESTGVSNCEHTGHSCMWAVSNTCHFKSGVNDVFSVTSVGNTVIDI